MADVGGDKVDIYERTVDVVKQIVDMGTNEVDVWEEKVDIAKQTAVVIFTGRINKSTVVS